MSQPQTPASCDDMADFLHKSDWMRRSESVKKWKIKTPSEIIAGFEALTLANDGVAVVEEGDELDILEATDMSCAQVFARINEILKTSVSGQNEYTFRVPSRKKAWQAYSKRLGRFVLLKSRVLDSGEVQTNMFTRDTRNKIQRKQAMQFHGMLCVMKELFQINHREYTSTVLSCRRTEFGNQDTCDELIEDVACCVGCKRDNLPVFTRSNGKIGGMVSYTYARKDWDQVYDCRARGQRIPYGDHKIEINNIGAKCIIVVDRFGVFDQLMNGDFLKEMPCVLLCGDGIPDIVSRKMLRRLSLEFKLPVFALTDCSSYGLMTFMTYLVGSEKLAYDSEDMCTPNIKWLGFKPSHLRGTYEIPKNSVRKFSKAQCRMLKELEWMVRVTSIPDICEEYENMERCREEFEIECLIYYGFSYFDFYVMDQLDRVTSVVMDSEPVQKIDEPSSGEMCNGQSESSIN